MKNYISIYDDILSPVYCNSLIQKFEENVECQTRESTGDDNWSMYFTQVNLYQHDIFKDDVLFLTTLFREAVEKYKLENNIQAEQWPKNFSYEQIRMKRYQANSNDRFDTHVDVSDYDSARRFLVLFFYLNDDFTGGETVFPELQIQCKPKAGRLITFPPLWTHPHKGNPILDGNPKYIVGTFLHYSL